MAKHIICLFDQEAEALKAVNILKEAGFNQKHISLIGKAEAKFEAQISESKVAAKTVGISALVGVLAGVGLTLIPGVGILYGIGAVAGAVAGFDAGLIGGSIISVLEIQNMESSVADQYKAQIDEGKILLAFAGNTDELTKAQSMLEANGTHATLTQH